MFISLCGCTFHFGFTCQTFRESRIQFNNVERKPNEGAVVHAYFVRVQMLEHTEQFLLLAQFRRIWFKEQSYVLNADDKQNMKTKTNVIEEIQKRERRQFDDRRCKGLKFM